MSWKITLHWTAGTNQVSALDKQHYHFIVDGNGDVHRGIHTVEDNLNTSDGKYAAHASMANTKNIGVSLAGMAGATESPFNAGSHPINETQLDVACKLMADLSKQYSVPINDKSVLTHAEIQPNLGIKQSGKWDITRLPWRDDLRGHKAVGDYIRSKVSMLLGNDQVVPIITTRPVVRKGSRGEHVVYLQEKLNAKGYNVGRADGIFGVNTDAQVRLFQKENGLGVDGIVGNNTWSKL